MTIPASVLVKMATIGLSAEQAEAVAAMLSDVEAATLAGAETVQEKSKEKARERWHKWKAKQTPTNVSKRLQTTANDSCGGDARGVDNLQTIEISGKEENKKESAPKARVDLDAFRDELSPILDPERIEALIAVRRKKGATMTPHAGRLLSKALRQCPDASAAADEMVLRNWTGIKPEWLESRATPQRQATSPPQREPRTVSERAIQRLQTGQTDYEPPDKPDRSLVQGFGSGQNQGASVLELVAIAANGYRRN